MPYQHGVRVIEEPTGVAAPISGTAGLQVVFGTAPVNLAKNPMKKSIRLLMNYAKNMAST